MKYHIKVNTLCEQVADLREKGSPVKVRRGPATVRGMISKMSLASLCAGREDLSADDPEPGDLPVLQSPYKAPTVDRGWFNRIFLNKA